MEGDCRVSQQTRMPAVGAKCGYAGLACRFSCKCFARFGGEALHFWLLIVGLGVTLIL